MIWHQVLSYFILFTVWLVCITQYKRWFYAAIYGSTFMWIISLIPVILPINVSICLPKELFLQWLISFNYILVSFGVGMFIDKFVESKRK